MAIKAQSIEKFIPKYHLPEGVFDVEGLALDAISDIVYPQIAVEYQLRFKELVGSFDVVQRQILASFSESSIWPDVLLAYLKDYTDTSIIRRMLLDKEQLPQLLHFLQQAQCNKTQYDVKRFEKQMQRATIVFDKLFSPQYGSEIDERKRTDKGISARRKNTQVKEVMRATVTEDSRAEFEKLLRAELTPEILNNAHENTMRIISSIMQSLQAVYTEIGEGITFYPELSTTRIKDFDSLVNKLILRNTQRRAELSEILDICGGRIVCKDYADVNKVVSYIEGVLGRYIHEKRATIVPSGDKPYFAIHYILAYDTHLQGAANPIGFTEIQLKVKDLAILNELEHNTGYKNPYGFSKEIHEAISQYVWTAQYNHLKLFMKDQAPNQLREIALEQYLQDHQQHTVIEDIETMITPKQYVFFVAVNKKNEFKSRCLDILNMDVVRNQFIDMVIGETEGYTQDDLLKHEDFQYNLVQQKSLLRLKRNESLRMINVSSPLDLNYAGIPYDLIQKWINGMSFNYDQLFPE